MAKCLIVWPTEVELHPLHVSSYTTLDLSSRAKENLRDGKHVFNFLVLKIVCAPIIAEIFRLTVWIASILDCKKGDESFNHLSYLGSDAFPSKFFFPSICNSRLLKSISLYEVKEK